MLVRVKKYFKTSRDLNSGQKIEDKIRCSEILGVAATGLGKFIFMDYLNWRLQYVCVAILAWTIYVFYRYKKNKNVIKDWGFRLDNFVSTLKLMMPFAIFSVITIFIVGLLQGSINFTWHFIQILISYPIWGSIQQFLTIGLLAGNLSNMKSVKLKRFSIILITAIFFSIVHFPSIWLMIGTFILALYYGFIYLKSKNLYALGLLHGWLGALFYYTVLNQDPFSEIFLKYF
ncbi:MAG: hypothetical protein Wins2KO_23970 [Winogradskyella sp.]